MGRLEGSTVLVTGASSGIGAACARRFAAAGSRLVLWARREGRLEDLAGEIAADPGASVRFAAVDVRDRAAVEEAAAALASEGIVPHVLVNNAGLAAGLDPLHEGDPDDWDRMIDTNLKGLLYVSRAFLPHMLEAGRGHVINVGSTAGHQVYPRGNVYNATKFGVTALTEGLNLDLAGTPLRASSVDPGFVETEFSVVRFHGDEERAEAVYEGFRPLSAEDVAETIHYMASIPEHINMFRVILLPAAQRNAYVVDRED